MKDHHETVTLIRSDGEKKQISFKEQPNWVLIKACAPISGNAPPGLDEHDRFDFNDREYKPWEKAFHKFIGEAMALFSEGMLVRAYWYNPFYPVAGMLPSGQHHFPVAPRATMR